MCGFSRCWPPSEDVHPAHIKCHPERSSRFAKRSSYVVEEPALSEAEGTPTRPTLPAKYQGILPVTPVAPRRQLLLFRTEMEKLRF